MNKYKHIEGQIESGFQIIKDLNNLKPTLPSIKIVGNCYLNSYSDSEIDELECRVDNWKKETMLMLSVIKMDLDKEKYLFMPCVSRYSIGDRRKNLVDEVQACIQFLVNIDDEEPRTSCSADEIAFLKKDLHIDTYKLIPELIPVVNSRIDEINKGINASMPLSIIILSGSTLECILLNLALRYKESFNKANSAPKDGDKKVLPYKLWKLRNYIDVAYDLGYLKEDVVKFSHILRDYRNYVHPNVQLEHGFNPNMHTAEMCFQVLKAAISEISEKLESLNALTI